MSSAFNKMTTALQTQRDLRNRLLDDVSHELSTPLSIIRLEAHALRKGLQAPSQAADRIVQEVNMLGNLVRDLGWLAETESDELQLAVEPCSIHQLLTAELARWQQQAEMDRITLSLDLPPDLPNFNLDPMRMSQALGNVIDNALRHTQVEGRVEVAATIEAGRQLTILVTDDGAGISSADLPHVVDRFYRADRSRSRRTGGRRPGAGHYARSRRSTRGHSFRFQRRPWPRHNRANRSPAAGVRRQTMFKGILLAGLVLLAAACTVTPAAPSVATKSVQESRLLAVLEAEQGSTPLTVSGAAQGTAVLAASEGPADCPGGSLRMLPGQTASDPIADDIPAYIDIISVDTSLDGETLTAVFYLREIPEEMEFNREGVKDLHSEYMWTIEIFVENSEESESEQIEYMLGAVYSARRVLADTPAATRPFQEAVRSTLWKANHDHEQDVTFLINVPVHVRMLVSHEEDTLTLISEVPGITSESTLLFSTYDILLGQDGVSCHVPVDSARPVHVHASDRAAGFDETQTLP